MASAFERQPCMYFSTSFGASTGGAYGLAFAVLFSTDFLAPGLLTFDPRIALAPGAPCLRELPRPHAGSAIAQSHRSSFKPTPFFVCPHHSPFITVFCTRPHVQLCGHLPPPSPQFYFDFQVIAMLIAIPLYFHAASHILVGHKPLTVRLCLH